MKWKKIDFGDRIGLPDSRCACECERAEIKKIKMQNGRGEYDEKMCNGAHDYSVYGHLWLFFH